MLSAAQALQQLRQGRFFRAWDGYVSAKRIASSEANIQRLIDELLSLGERLTEDDARRAVDECVRCFNDLDDGWICTIEREDIFEQIGRVIDVCGFDYDEGWLDERDW